MTNLHIMGTNYDVPDHWFWNEFRDGWEPETLEFFKQHITPGSTYLDVGAWVGPTAMIASALGANKVKAIEPNPNNYRTLLDIQLNNGLLEQWSLANVCVSDKRGELLIGPIEGINSRSSATNIRANTTGAHVMSVLLSDVIADDSYDLMKVDIEGAEALIISSICDLPNKPKAIWLSIHPPFMTDHDAFLDDMIGLYKHYDIDIPYSTLCHRVLSSDKYPSWGTPYGNFFEIGLIQCI